MSDAVAETIEYLESGAGARTALVLFYSSVSEDLEILIRLIGRVLETNPRMISSKLVPRVQTYIAAREIYVRE